jgi:hypothetical protein
VHVCRDTIPKQNHRATESLQVMSDGHALYCALKKKNQQLRQPSGTVLCDESSSQPQHRMRGGLCESVTMCQNICPDSNEGLYACLICQLEAYTRMQALLQVAVWPWQHLFSPTKWHAQVLNKTEKRPASCSTSRGGTRRTCGDVIFTVTCPELDFTGQGGQVVT